MPVIQVRPKPIIVEPGRRVTHNGGNTVYYSSSSSVSSTSYDGTLAAGDVLITTAHTYFVTARNLNGTGLPGAAALNIFDGDDEDKRVGNTSTDVLLSAKVAGDKYPRLRMLASGSIVTGDGTTAPANQVGAASHVTAGDAQDLVDKLEAARVAGGGEVYVPDGTYSLTSATGPAIVASQVRLRMEPGATITQAAGANLAALVQSYDYVAQLATNTSSAEHDFVIEGGVLDGNASNNSGTTVGLRLYAYRYSVQDIRITNCDGAGFKSDWHDTDTSTPDVQEAHVHGVWISKCADTGLDFNGPHDSVMSNIMIGRITGGNGAYFGGDATGTQVVNMHTWSTTGGYGIYADTAVHFSNCQAEGGLSGQVYINDAVIWSGGRVFDADTFGSSAHKGFVFGPLGFSATIVGVRISQCNSGAFDFTNGTGGNSKIQANVWQSRNSGTVIVGTPSDSVMFDLHFSFDSLSSITGVTSTDTFTKTAHGLLNDAQVIIRSKTGGSGLTVGSTYYVVNKTTDTFQLSLTSGGAAVDLGTDVSAMSVSGFPGWPATTKRRHYEMRGWASGTTLGTVTGKIQVLDDFGNSLGYLPLYDAIT